MNAPSQQFDLCIVGGGLVGLTLAALLCPTGLAIAVVEARPLPEAPPAAGKDEYAPRVSAINLASMRIFRQIGIEQAIVAQRACGYRSMQIWDANSNARITFDGDDIDHEYLGYIIENDLIIYELHQFIKDNNNVTIFSDSLQSLSREGALVSLDLGERRLQTALLVGADGQFSRVRSLAGFSVETGLFNQVALVCRIKTELPHRHTAYQCFHHSGPIAYLPLADGSCSIVWSCDRNKARALQQLDDHAFAADVEEAMQSVLGKISVAGPRVAFELAQQHAQRYIEPQIALIGDAAHRTHPLAGLGANIGMQDAATLAEVIEDALAQRRPFENIATLRKYERIRKHQNALVLTAMQAFKSGFASPSPILGQLRAAALNSADSIIPVKRLLSRLATGDSGDLPRICQPGYEPAQRSRGQA